MRLFLNGGGSDNQITSAINKMNEIIDHTKPLLYVPLAMDELDYPYDGCYEWISTQLENVDIPSIEMVRSFEELASKNLANYSAIFIGGGNTYKLLKGIKESGSFHKIQDYINNDGIVFGGSAGALIFGKDIDVIKSMDDNEVNLTDTIGFDVINGVSIFPHYTNRKSKLTEEENEIRHKEFTKSIIDFSESIGPVIAYPEEDTIFINGDKIEMIGSSDYYYIENGNVIKYEINDKENIKKLNLK